MKIIKLNSLQNPNMSNSTISLEQPETSGRLRQVSGSARGSAVITLDLHQWSCESIQTWLYIFREIMILGLAGTTMVTIPIQSDLSGLNEPNSMNDLPFGFVYICEFVVLTQRTGLTILQCESWRVLHVSVPASSSFEFTTFNPSGSTPTVVASVYCFPQTP